jgi:hypothetical protein
VKYLLEFASLKDMAKSKNVYLQSIIDQEFQEDEPLIDIIFDDHNPKHFYKLDWYDTDLHIISYRIKTRTNINSISDFNSIVEYGINYVFPNSIATRAEKGQNGKIYEGGRYAFHFNNHEFYMMVSFYYDDLFEDETKLTIVTLGTPNELGYIPRDIIIEIYGD